MATTHSPKLSKTNGNAIVDGSDVYVVYWDPDLLHYHHEWLELIDFFSRERQEAQNSTADVFADGRAVHGQDQAAYNTVFMGSYTDTTPYPAAAGAKILVR